MAAKKKSCGWFKSSHRFGTKVKPVRPGTFQKVCTRCGRVYNFKCGTFFSPHQFKRDRRIKNKRIVKCKKCSEKKTL